MRLGILREVLLAAVLLLWAGDRHRDTRVILRGRKQSRYQPSPLVTLPARQGAAVEWAAQRVAVALVRFGRPAPQPALVAERAAGDLEAEAFTIRRAGSHLLIRAGGRTGEMYALLAVAERIGNAAPGETWEEFLARETWPAREAPYLHVRADNSFLQVKAGGLALTAQKLKLIAPPLLFEDMGRWEAYLDLLAENRFNLLDLHGAYNLTTTSFHNLLPFFVTVPDYSRVGSRRNQRENRAALRHLLAYARDRGLDVSMMSYSARVEGLSAAACLDYTKKAVALLLKEVPGLKRLGFRIGESGETPKFYADAYVQGLHDSGRTDVQFYTRSWKTNRTALEELAGKVNGRLTVEVKYNGEQLGLPYQAIQGPRNSGYSYMDVAGVQKPYELLWQVRANGTMRFWTWAETAFIRRAVRSFRFGGANEFTLEPESAYFSSDPADFYRRPEDQAVYRYQWQKNWAWYAAWGRLAYNPDLPEAELMAVYRSHFGRFAGEAYAAAQASGAIVPLALAYRFTGPDQRNMSPETQSGALDTVHDTKVTPLSFALNTPMDDRSFVGIHEYVTSRLAGRPDGRIGPRAVAELMSARALETRQAVERADRDLAGGSEWRLLKTDLLAASYLGDYYASRIRGTMHLDYALRTGSEGDFAQAQGALATSRQDWSRLAKWLDPIYAPLENPQIGQRKFKWGDEGRRLEKLDELLPAMWKARQPEPTGGGIPLLLPAADKMQVVKVIQLDAVVTSPGTARVTCHTTRGEQVRKVTLWSKGFASNLPWQPVGMSMEVLGSYSTDVRLPPDGLLYLVAVEETSDMAFQFPSPLEETPFRTIDR